jgi:hypothetical protein
MAECVRYASRCPCFMLLQSWPAWFSAVSAWLLLSLVGFTLDNHKAKVMLAKCATSSDHSYSAENGDQLLQAFRDIAPKILA